MAEKFWQKKGIRVDSEYWATNRCGDVNNYDKLVKQKNVITKFQSVVNSKKVFCDQPFINLSITAEGNILLCCNDWRQRVVFGSVKNRSIKEVWDREFQQARNDFRFGAINQYDLCRTCKR